MFKQTNILIFLTAIAACSDGTAAERTVNPTPVYVRIVAEETALASQRYSGSVEPATRVDVAFKVGGYVRSLAEVNGRVLQDGDRIEKGAILAIVKESDYQARLDTARSSLAEARASERQAELDYERSAKLLKSKSVSQAETDSMIVRLDVAKARVAGAMAKVREASLALEDCTVRAPMSGVILKRSVEIGSLVGTGAPAFSIADLAQVKVVFGAPDRMVEKLALGAELEVEIPAVGDRVRGKISRIAPAADRSSRVFDVETTIDNPKQLLKAGMIASLSVPASALEKPALALPLTSILRSPNDARGFAVLVVDGDKESGTARMRDVALGELLGNQVLVLSGLERGERVVSMGASLLADGTAVRIIPTTEK